MAQVQDNSSSNDSGKVRAKKQVPHVDMAPLCDLGFLLVTFFMFAATSTTPNIMNLNMPPHIPEKDKIVHPPGEVDVLNSITLILGKDNRLFWHQTQKGDLTLETLNETDYSAQGLRQQIRDANARAKDADIFTVIIKPTDDSNYKNLVDVLDEMEITQSQRYGIVEVTPAEISVYEEKVGK